MKIVEESLFKHIRPDKVEEEKKQFNYDLWTTNLKKTLKKKVSLTF